MFEFGRDLKRFFGAAAGRLDVDPSLFELVDVQALATQARSLDTYAGRVSTREPFRAYVEAATIWREHARRSGDPAALRKAAASAQSASRAARNTGEASRATLEQALVSLTGADLYGDSTLLDAARNLFSVSSSWTGDALFEARLEAAYARLASREALAADSYHRALEAAALFDAAVHRFDHVAASGLRDVIRLESAHARIERADLMAGFGVRLRETRLLESAVSDLTLLLAGLDADYEPLTWGRTAEILGAAMVSLGEMQGCPAKIAEGVSILNQVEERFTQDHSPLDWVRWRHALGVGLQALGEACEYDAAFSQAERAFDDALDGLHTAPVAIRSTIANNRAACLARGAERRGDVAALGKAEAGFRRELARLQPSLDPVGWAVLQVNLARIYEARAELTGVFPEREAAVYALEEAFEVFSEAGMKTMAESASEALKRVAKI